MPTDKIARLRELYNKRGRSNLHQMEYSEAVEDTYPHLLAIAEKAEKVSGIAEGQWRYIGEDPRAATAALTKALTDFEEAQQ